MDIIIQKKIRGIPLGILIVSFGALFVGILSARTAIGFLTGKETINKVKKRRKTRKVVGENNKGGEGKRYPRTLYNLGNTCFANSVLQSLSSLNLFCEYVENKNKELSSGSMVRIRRKQGSDEEIIWELYNVLKEIEPTEKRRGVFVPKEFLRILGGKAPWVWSREEQDAQEFFQIITQTLEGAKIEKKQSLKQISESEKETERRRNPFSGLAASKIACVRCGYTASLRHYSIDSISLPVPRVGSCRVEDCLKLYTGIDELEDFRCRRCVLEATVKEKKEEAEKTSGKRKRERLEKEIIQVEDALKNDPEKELGTIELSGKLTGPSTRQTMIARAPKLLCLHLNRSLILNTGDVVKNPAKIVLGSKLNLSPFLTTGHLDTRPLRPISQSSPQPTMYTLTAIVSHDGSHSSGHYYAYKRVDTNSTVQWFRVADSNLNEVSESIAIGVTNAFMLFYTKDI
ncbi:hypothetical protein BB558_006347 [Smittium angustum]|uniref:ubiquitinyl hydrolase 1 n=1 Tax=Smittium angustum TaxID=133377 RepID=A0A2U1IXZ8_SMIAN|nr:hypothetical protein BB558_006347 [Smittium angustum]